jgi:5'-nucleotidase
MVTWEDVDTVLLDMDGTLLDLRYDNHFWLEHLPRHYARLHGMPFDNAKTELINRYRRVEGTLEWYCLDYWTRELDIDIPLLKQEVDHMIAVRPHGVEFLAAVRASNKYMMLVTNAHATTLALKLGRTRIGAHFDAVVCAHEIGAPKEEGAFWDKLQTVQPFDKRRALFIDDSLPVLRAARAHGVAQLLSVLRPDSQGPTKDAAEFTPIGSFRQIMPPVKARN